MTINRTLASVLTASLLGALAGQLLVPADAQALSCDYGDRGTWSLRKVSVTTLEGSTDHDSAWPEEAELRHSESAGYWIFSALTDEEDMVHAVRYSDFTCD